MNPIKKGKMIPTNKPKPIIQRAKSLNTFFVIFAINIVTFSGNNIVQPLFSQ
jgi:hypothetical protein